MSRTKGTFTLTSNIEPKVGAPLDARTIVKLKTDLTANGTFEYPYIGLTVFVTEENKKYTLIGADPTVAANWREEGSGTTTTADHVTYDNTTSELESTNVQDAIDEIVDDIDSFGTAAEKDYTDQVTEDSTDLITSGAVYDALENLPSDDTWRSVQVNGTEVQDGTTSSGALKLVNGTNTTVAFDSTNKTIQVNATDTNTTYSLTQDQSDGHKITLTPSSGSAQTLTIPDNNTTYTFENGTNSFKVTPSGGTAQTVNVTPSIADATQSASGLMSASDKTKIDGIASGAEVNVQSDWNQTTDTADDFIKNKPNLGTAATKNYTTSVTQNSTDLVTSGAVWTAIDNLPEPMIMKGTLGTNGTITTLPTASASNEGFVYKVITAGTYAGQAAKVGDFFVSCKPEGASSYSWIWFPSGDESFTDTWRNIKVNGTEKLGTGISTGAVDFINGTNTTVEFDATGNKIKINATDTNTHRPIQMNGTQILGDNTTALNLKAGDNVTLTNNSGEVTIAATDTKYTAATAAPADINTSGAVGTSTNYARQDHTHKIALATGDNNGQVKIAGTNVSVKGLGTAAYKASTDFATCTELSNVDLNTVLTPGFYNCGGGNTCTNKPSGVQHFGLEVIHDASGSYYTQIIYDTNTSKSYRRWCVAGTWSAWTEDKFTDTDRYVNSAAFADDTTNNANSPVKMTLTRAGSDTATVTANIPKVSSSGAGVVPKGTTVSSQSQSTKFLREDGTWAAPSYTTNTDQYVKQSPTTDNGAYELLFSSHPDNTERTSIVKKTTTLRFNPSKGALMEGDQTVASGTSSHAEGTESTASGTSSHAEGFKTCATNYDAHAEGQKTLARGEDSHAEGKQTTAYGNYSHAEGLQTIAYENNSHAEGQSTSASGITSHAEGFKTTASGNGSHAEGGYTSKASGGGNLASGENAHAEGFGTTASGKYAHAEGNNTKANGQDAHAEGSTTSASGADAHAEGSRTLASSGCAHAEGYMTSAIDSYSHAEGYKTKASGGDSHAEGDYTKASGKDSHAEGEYTEASGEAAHAEGYYAVASGKYSHAEGYWTTASGNQSHASGQETSAAGEAQTVIGKYNIADTTSLFIIGNGTSSARSNAMKVSSDGNLTITKINGVTVGNDPKFTDNNTTYTFAGGTNKITVTPSGGTAQDVAITVSDSTKVAKAGDTMTGSLQIGSSAQNTLPTVGLRVHDVRNTTIKSNLIDRAVNFLFAGGTTNTPSAEWWSIMHVQGWNASESYNAWEIAGPATTGDQRTTPLYLRTSNGNVWGSWRQMYDSSNKPDGVKDIGNSTNTTFAYSKSGLNYSNYTWLAAWNGYELRAVNKNQFVSTTTDYSLFETKQVKVDYQNWADTDSVIHKNGRESVVFGRFFAQNDEANYTTYHYPCVDSHIITFTIDDATQYFGSIAQDIRTHDLYIGGKDGGTWRSWRKVADSSNVTTGDANGQIKIAGTNVSVKGLGSAAYTASTNYALSKPSQSGTMNDVATYTNSMGMINLSGTDTTVNPNGQTGWHHFINVSYNVETSNMWQTQIATKAGTTDLWVRSRAGGSISAGTAWAAPWTRILTGSNYSSVLGNVYAASSHTHTISQVSWPGNQNLSASASANSQEWSIDLTPGSYTGTYFHVWSSKNSKSILCCYTDDNRVTIPNGTLTVSSTITGANVVASGVLGTSATNGTSGGIALYGAPNNIDEYGIYFRKTSDKGTHGYVTSDWATYFTMSNTNNRGWVFRRNGSGNVASIDTNGRMVLNTSMTVGSTSAGGSMTYNSTNKTIEFIVT